MQYLASLYIITSFLVFANAEVQVLDTRTDKKDTVTMIAGLSWHSDIDTAYAIAKKENTKVIIMVGEDHCKWCKKMKERTFIDARIKEKFEKYTLVSVKRSDKSAIKHVPSFDGNIPSLFFMQNTREPIEAVVGYFIANDLLDYVQEIEEQ